MNLNPELTIVLPIYNPTFSWGYHLHDSLKKIAHLFSGVSHKIIIVNDGSSTKLEEGINYLNQTYHNIEFVSYPKNRGKGFAIRTGLQKANSTYYIYADWDFPFGEKAVLNTYKALKNNQIDVVIGTRTKSYYKSLPLFRRVLSISLRSVNYILLGFKNIDTQAGLKGLNENARIIFLTTKTNSFIFEFEFIKKLVKQNLNLKYLSVHPRKNIHFTNFSTTIIMNEFSNFLKIIFSNK